MIPYEELERALARWKAKTQSAAGAPEEATEHVVQEMDAAPNGVNNHNGDQGAEISLEEEVIETYED